MAWSVDQTTLGSIGQAGSDTTVALTTTAAAASGSWIFANVTFWTNTGATLTGLSGGGLSWESVQVALHSSAQNCATLWRAYAPSGLASSSTLTATYSAGVFNRGIGAASFAGGAVGSSIADTSTNEGGSGGAFSVDVTAANTTDLEVAAYNLNGASGGNTPDGNTTELIDEQVGTGPCEYVLMYRLAGTTGAVTLGGSITGGNTWSIAGGAFTAAVVVEPPAPITNVIAPRLR